MVRNWSKVLLVSLVIMALFASMAFASTSRVRSLASTGDYITDDSNVFGWYSVLPMYANQVNAEVGQWFGQGTLSDTRAMSLNYACGEEGKWGTYRLSLNENMLDHPGLWMANPFFSMLLPGSAVVTGPSSGFALTPANKWDLAGGWEVGEDLLLGVSFTRSSWSFESSDPDTTADQSLTTIGAGATWTNNEDLTTDFTFTFASSGGEGTFGGTDPVVVEWDSGTAFELAGRAFWDWKDYATLVPVVRFQTAEYSLKDNQDPTFIGGPGTGDKYTNFLLGVGCNIDVNTDNLLIIAAEFNSMKWEMANGPDDTVPDNVAQEISTTYLPTIRMALETAINSWMTTRVGAQKHLGTFKVTEVDGDETEWEVGAEEGFLGISPIFSDGFEWTLGLGFNVAEWTIDLELADDAPFSTFYWVTGYTGYDADGEEEGPVTRISATYNF